jgi:UDP-N-acetylglucosamine transferase subunit ALG13
MILVTVGGQLPFDRLIHAVDRWAMDSGRDDVFAQIGNSTRPPSHVTWERFLSPSDFQAKARESELIIAHAGIGSILTALELEKPIVVMPRRAHLGEHRNDHQWATVKHLGGRAGLTAVADEGELLATLGTGETLPAPTREPAPEYASLLEFLGGAIQGVR